MSVNSKRGNKNFLFPNGVVSIFYLITYLLFITRMKYVTVIVKDFGSAYFAASFIVVLICSFLFQIMVRDMMGKIIALRVNRGQYKNSLKVFRTCLLFAICLSLILVGILFLLSKFITGFLLGNDQVFLMFVALTPILIFIAMNESLKGFFQGMSTMLPTCMAEIIEQVFSLLFTVVLTKHFGQYGHKVGAILNDNRYEAIYGVIGCFFAMVIGSVISFLFLGFVFLAYNSKYKSKVLGDTTKNEEDSFQIIKGIYGHCSSYILVGILLFLNFLISLKIYLDVVKNKSNVEQGLSDYGMFFGKYLLYVGLFLFVIVVMTQGTTDRVSKLFAKNGFYQIRNEIRSSLTNVAIVGAIGSILLMVTSSFLVGKIALSGEKEMLIYGGFAILIHGILLYLIQVTNGLNGKLIQVLFVVVALVIQAFALMLLVSGMAKPVLALVIAYMLFGLVLAALNLAFIYKKLH